MQRLFIFLFGRERAFFTLSSIPTFTNTFLYDAAESVDLLAKSFDLFSKIFYFLTSPKYLCFILLSQRTEFLHNPPVFVQFSRHLS
jgi:hypothetical protein